MQHHAYLIVGEPESAREYLDSVFSEYGVRTAGNPDFYSYRADVFGVDDAREVGEKASAKAFGERMVFVIEAQKFTAEAQNALLKTLEDPVPNTHFFILAREAAMFLPTLLSRMHRVDARGESDEGSEAKKFLKKNLKQRLAFAKKFADEKDERGAGALAEFLDSLLLILKEDGAPTGSLQRVLDARTYARDSGAMPRLILEHLALVLP